MSYTPPSENKISINNSLLTGTGLLAGATYTGTSEDVSKYGRVGISIYTAFGNPTDGTLWIEVSRDNVNWSTIPRTFSDTSTAQPHMWNIVEKYFRIRYVNGTTPTGTDFSIQTQYAVNSEILLGHQLDEFPLPEHEAVNVRSFTPSVFDFSDAGLAAAATYTSQTFDTLINGYGVAVSIKSVTDGTHFYDESNDGINWAEMESESIVGGVEYAEIHTCSSRYFRVRFLNNGVINAGGTTNFYHAVSQRANLPNKEQSATRISDKNSFIGVTVSATPGTTIQGESETVEGYTSISVSVSSTSGDSLNGTLWFQVSRDGILWNSIPRDIRGSDKSIPFLIAITRKYFKVKYVNGFDSGGNTIATTTTTNFQLQTIYARGRSLDLTLPMGGTIQDKDSGILSKTVLTGRLDSGNYKNVTVDTNGHLEVNVTNPNTSYDEISIAELTPINQISFPYNINADCVSTILGGTGTVTQADNMALVSTGAGGTAIESAAIESKNNTPFRAGQGALARFSALFTDNAPNGATSVQGIGVGDALDGYGFALIGSVMNVSYRTNGAVVTPPANQTNIAQTLWNNDVMDGSKGVNNPSGMLLDPTMGNVYQISYGSGFGCINFSIESQETGRMILVHILLLANVRTVPSSYNPSFSLRAEVFKVGTADAADYQMKVSDMSSFVEGRSEVTGPVNGFSHIGTTNGLAVVPLLTLYNKTTFATKTNKVSSLLKSISIANGSGEAAVIKIIENGTLTGAAAPVDISTATSVMATDIVATAITGGRVIWTGSASKDGGISVSLSDLNLVMLPGSYYTITTACVLATAARPIAASVVWQEDF